MIDMHAHICSYNDMSLAKEELAYRSNAGIATFFSAGTPEEYRFMTNLLTETDERQRSGYHITFGIHPWYSDRYTPDDWTDYYRNCPVVGEIGMDMEWCEVPVCRQQKVFEKQLLIAADLKKPVILHTKACELRIAQMIRDYPYPVIVHWYSGYAEALYPYIDKGCYFTLGPDTGLFKDPRHKVLQNVPPDHLFLETDGLNAILWVYEKADPENQYDLKQETDLSLIGDTLTESLLYASGHFSMTREEMVKQMEQNLIKIFSLM